MNDPDSAFVWGNGIRDDPAERLWGYSDLTPVEDWPSAALPGGLVSLAFITAALKRRAWLWCLTAVLGLVIGSGLYLKYPPAYHASVTVLLVDNPNQDPIIQIQNDQAMAQSQPVAAVAVRQLGLGQAVGSFQAASTVTVVTDNVLMFNVGAPSANDALIRVNALATGFLQYRAQYALAEQQQQVTELDQQFSQAEQNLTSINARISQIPTPPSSAEQAQLSKLQTQRTEALQVEQYVNNTKATTQTATSAMVHDSKILGEPTSIPRSHVKGVALYVAGGLFGGLVLGMVIVILTALLSDRLYRRDDVAEAIGAPVRLSVGTLRRRRLPRLRGRAARERDMRRIVAHLRGAIRRSSRGTAGLAVVAVDNTPDVARAVVSLAASCARNGKQVVLADLTGGALGKLVGAKSPGVHPVSVDGQRMIAAVPDHNEVTPTGPLPTQAQHAPASETLVAACASADLLFTLATLDPAFGGDHLATWATDAVVIVTAGQSSAERIHAVGEMVKLAGTRVDSVVLIGAEKSDESLGTPLAPEEEPTQVKLN